ncbi:hypothetical protein PINS_up005673 [Pythium insidiosum]|nr:hypothetical protein PINS_up005673 [Pythium insidiosum]
MESTKRKVPKASRDGASPVLSPSSKAAKSSMFDLTVDRNFEFDGGTGFGLTLPSNRPLPATTIAIAAPVGSPTDAHRFTFTSAGEYTSPKKVPVFPGTIHSPERPKKESYARRTLRSPTAKAGQHSSQPGSPHPSVATSASKHDTLASSFALAAASSADASSRRDASPRKFLLETLASSEIDSSGNATTTELRAADVPRRGSSQFIDSHDPVTGATSVAVADAAAEAAAANAATFLQTGEDAIAFFARNGSDSEIKFVHLNRAQTGVRFRPYDLVVVDPDDVESEHFTMSADGLVHMAPGQPSEFHRAVRVDATK